VSQNCIRSLEQWFSNCGTRTTNGTRRPSRWCANRPTFCFFSKNYIHSYSFYLSSSFNKFLNFCVACFLCRFLKMANIISHSHFVHVAFVSILIFQTLVEWYLAHWVFLEQGGTWWQYGIHRWCAIRKSLGTNALEELKTVAVYKIVLLRRLAIQWSEWHSESNFSRIYCSGKSERCQSVGNVVSYFAFQGYWGRWDVYISC